MTPWYVVQVRAGQEARAMTLIEQRAKEAESLEEAESPLPHAAENARHVA